MRHRPACRLQTTAPNGGGVLVHPNAGGEARNTFTFYTKAGKVSSLDVGPNAGFSTWLPGTATALMHTSVGHDYRFLLIDWNAGKRLWDVRDPNPARVPGAGVPVDQEKVSVENIAAKRNGWR